MRLISIFITFLCFISGYTQALELDKELLWEISSPKSTVKSYLFGTLHANDRALFELSDSVYIAFDKAQKIILETDIYQLFSVMDTRKSLPETRFDDKGKSYTSVDLSSKTRYGDEDGMPQFLDAYFQVLGLQLNKEMVALEKIQDQYAFSNEFKLNEGRVIETQGHIVENQINSFTQEKLLALYLHGDLDALQRFMKSYLSVQEKRYEEVIVARNQQMLDKLLLELKSQKSFFCAVGAGHLGGEEGLLQLLRTRGYKVRSVRWTFQEKAPASKRLLQQQAYTYIDSLSGMVAKFPGKPLIKTLSEGNLKLIYRELGQGNTYEITLFALDTTITTAEIASIYINPPDGTAITKKILDNGSMIYQGLSDTYPEGLNFVQIKFGSAYYAVIKCYGGHKFMHSNRPFFFFDKVWFD